MSNDNQLHPHVALEQADGLGQLGLFGGKRGDPGDVYPGSTQNHTFDLKSNPNSQSYAQKDTGVAITNISEPGPVMTFDYKVTTSSSSNLGHVAQKVLEADGSAV
jgi:immune inhibitor A